MKNFIRYLTIALLMSIYVVTLFAVLHPHVTPAYKAFYIDRASTDANPVHYPGTPEQGIVLNRQGLPVWVQYTRGLSYRDDWGRWTDEDLGNIASLRFTQTLNGPLCLDFAVRAVPWMVGRRVAVRIGNETQTVQVAATDLTEYRVQFAALRGADSVALILPDKLPPVHSVVPTNGDRRRLALNLNSLRLVPGECPVVKTTPEASQ